MPTRRQHTGLSLWEENMTTSIQLNISSAYSMPQRLMPVKPTLYLQINEVSAHQFETTIRERTLDILFFQFSNPIKYVILDFIEDETK